MRSAMCESKFGDGTSTKVVISNVIYWPLVFPSLKNKTPNLLEMREKRQRAPGGSVHSAPAEE